VRMSVLLDTPFATAEDTAAALGVSKSRLKRLLRLVGPVAEGVRHQGGNGLDKSAARQRKGPRVSAKRRKQTRGKAKKAAH
jgi:hypothetical protein